MATGLSKITTLNSGVINFNISENSGASSVSVNCSFNDDKLFTGSNAHFDYEVSFNTNEITSITNAQINGEIKVIGHNKEKLKVAEEFLENTIYTQSNASKHEAKYVGYLYNVINEEYNKLSIPYSLRSYPTTTNISKNETDGIISLNASFDNSYQPSDNVKSSTWSIQVQPPIRKYIATQDVLTFPKHIFFNSNVIKRSNIQINVNASSYDSINQSYGLTTVDNFATNIYNTYVSPNSDIVENTNTLNFSEVSLSYTRNKSWGFHQDTEWVTLPAPPKP